MEPSFTILKILAQSTNVVDIKHWCFGKILVILGGLDILLQYWFRKQAKVSVFVSDRIQYHEPTQRSSNREIIWETLFTVMWQQWSVGVYRMDSDDDINHIWKFCHICFPNVYLLRRENHKFIFPLTRISSRNHGFICATLEHKLLCLWRLSTKRNTILLQYWFRKQAKVSVFGSDRIQYHEPTQRSSNREIIWETLSTVMWQQWSLWMVGVYRMDSDDDVNHVWKFCHSCFPNVYL